MVWREWSESFVVYNQKLLSKLVPSMFLFYELDIVDNVLGILLPLFWRLNCLLSNYQIISQSNAIALSWYRRWIFFYRNIKSSLRTILSILLKCLITPYTVKKWKSICKSTSSTKDHVSSKSHQVTCNIWVMCAWLQWCFSTGLQCAPSRRWGLAI